MSAELPEKSLIFIVVQIEGQHKSVNLMCEELRKEIVHTTEFVGGMMGKKRPAIQIYETQVA